MQIFTLVFWYVAILFAWMVLAALMAVVGVVAAVWEGVALIRARKGERWTGKKC